VSNEDVEEVNQTVRNPGCIHQFTGENEEWNGQQEKVVKADKDPLGDQNKRHLSFPEIEDTADSQNKSDGNPQNQ
jgi:hypothetical protein